MFSFCLTEPRDSFASTFLLVILQPARKCKQRENKGRVFASWLFLKLENIPLTGSGAKLEEKEY